MASGSLFYLIKAKSATDFIDPEFHAVILKGECMRKMYIAKWVHLVYYEIEIPWKKNILTIEYIRYIILPQIQKVILTEAQRINAMYPDSLRFELTCLDKVASKKLEGSASLLIACS